MGDSKRIEKPKNISSREKSETKNKVGKNISVSSWDNPDIKQHIRAKEDTILSTEHVKYTKLKKNESEQEKKKEKFSFFKKKTKAAEKNIKKISYIELDTGTIEIGYDKKTNEVVLTFMYDTKREEIHDAKAKNESEKAKEESKVEHSNFETNKKVITVYGNISSGNDVKKSGTVTVRCGKNNILESIRKELYSGKKINDKSYGTKPPRRDNLYLLERILPFSDTNYEEERIKEIRQEKSTSKTDRSNMHTAMYMLKNVEAAKKYREMQLSKCFKEASEVANEYKTGSGRKVITYDEYYLGILRKQKIKRVATAVGGVASAAGVAVGVAAGIAAALKSKEKKKTSGFDKLFKTDHDKDSIADEEITETNNENYLDENINNDEQEKEIIDKENPDYEDLEENNENEYEYEENENGEEDEDEEYDEDEDDEEDEDNEYDEDEDDEEDEDEEYDEDEDDEEDEDNEYDENEEDEDNESENDEKIEQEEPSKGNGESEDRNNSQEESDNVNKERKKPKKKKTKKKTLDESKLPTETNDEDNEILEDETQDFEETNNNENKSGGE